jgi:hypothetical protein
LVSQAGSTVAGHQIGGDYRPTIYEARKSAGVVEQLLRKLHHEVENNIHASETLSRLQRYHGGLVTDDVRGLTAKLERAGRSRELETALERKEMFAKLLEHWSHYASAQEIFAYLLARAEHFFTTEILPSIDDLSEIEINQRMNILIVNPTVEECGATVFQIDHLTAMGMVYWLAEQCFVRWH